MNSLHSQKQYFHFQSRSYCSPSLFTNTPSQLFVVVRILFRKRLLLFAVDPILSFLFDFLHFFNFIGSFKVMYCVRVLGFSFLFDFLHFFNFIGSFKVMYCVRVLGFWRSKTIMLCILVLYYGQSLGFYDFYFRWIFLIFFNII